MPPFTRAAPCSSPVATAPNSHSPCNAVQLTHGATSSVGCAVRAISPRAPDCSSGRFRRGLARAARRGAGDVGLRGKLGLGLKVTSEGTTLGRARGATPRKRREEIVDVTLAPKHGHEFHVARARRAAASSGGRRSCRRSRSRGPSCTTTMTSCARRARHTFVRCARPRRASARGSRHRTIRQSAALPGAGTGLACLGTPTLLSMEKLTSYDEWAASSGPPRRPHSQRAPRTHVRTGCPNAACKASTSSCGSKKRYRTVAIRRRTAAATATTYGLGRITKLMSRAACRGALHSAGPLAALHARTAHRGSSITMGSGASSTAAAAPAKDSKKPVQLLPTHNVQVPRDPNAPASTSACPGAPRPISTSTRRPWSASPARRWPILFRFKSTRDATPASIVHTGDVLTSGTGTGTTDLERIYVQPEAMEKRGVDNIFLVVNVYTQGRTFCGVNFGLRAFSARGLGPGAGAI